MSSKVKWDRGAWWVITHHQGRRRKKRIGVTKADKRRAEKIAEKVNAAIALGDFTFERAEQPPTPTLGELSERWLRVEIDLPIERGLGDALAPKTAELHRLHLEKRILPVLGDREVASLGVGDVQGVYESCLQAKKPPSTRTIEMTMGTLGRLLAYAEAQEITHRNVVAAWKRARGRRRGTGVRPITRDKALDSRELAKLLEVARARFPHFYPFLLFLADTGARLGEASAMRWVDMDLDAREARIQRSFSDGRSIRPTKTGQERTVELSGRLCEVLVGIEPDLYGAETLVFMSEEGEGFIDPHNFRARVFRPVVEKALGKGRKFSPHGLRHTFAILHLARGSNLKWVQTMGGWASAKLVLDL